MSYNNGERSGDSDDEEETLLATTHHRAKRVIDGFLDFAMQGNVMEVACGLM